MQKFLYFLGIIYLVSSVMVNRYIDGEGRTIEHHIHTSIVMDQTHHFYNLSYNVHMLGGNHIVNLDTISGISQVQCDVNNIDIAITFYSEAYAIQFLNIINLQRIDRFITSAKYNCNDAQAKAQITMRKVLGTSRYGTIVYLTGAQGFYEQTIKEGDISLQPIENTTQIEKRLCFGANSKNCDTADGPIMLYQGKYVTISCSNCFVGARATIFMELSIRWFKLKRVASGFKDIGVKGAFELTMDASGNWGTSTEKLIRLVEQQTIITFWIGPIPISIWYELPLHIIMNAALSAEASVTAGAYADYSIGDAYISWDDQNGWKTVKPNPVFKFEKVLKGQASFHGEGSIAIVPEIILHITRVLEAGLTFDPTLMLEVQGSTEKRELCADLKYKVSSHLRAGIEINIAFIKIFQKQFGPYELFNKGGNIGHWCVKV